MRREPTNAPSLSASELPKLEKDRRGPIALVLLAFLAGAGGYLALRESPKPLPVAPLVEVKPPPLEPVVVDAAVAVVEAPVVDAGAPPVAVVNRTPGSLVLEATPWAEVTVDGRNVGETPLGNVTVAPGMHTLLFKNPESGKSVKRTVQVNPGQRLSLRVDLR